MTTHADLMRELVAALDDLPARRLIRGRLTDQHGGVCAIGSICLHKRIDLRHFSFWKVFGYDAGSLLERINDCRLDETDEQRFTRVRNWALKQLEKAK